MFVQIKFWKNSNTGKLMKSQSFHETSITGIPTYFYDVTGVKIGEDLSLDGFVEIKEKKFKIK
jgi:hypothetical protein